MNKDKIILDLCGGTGAWSRPYKEAGYTVHNVTLPHFDLREIEYKYDTIFFGGNLFVKMNDIYGILAAPPCTMFSLARSTGGPRDFEKGMEAVEICLRLIWEVRKRHKLAFWAMENPQGLLRQFMGNPAYSFDTSEFGADYNKKTDLWGYFKEPRKTAPVKRFASTDKNTRKLPPLPKDYVRDPNMNLTAIKRSITNGKFAEAFFKANR